MKKIFLGTLILTNILLLGACSNTGTDTVNTDNTDSKKEATAENDKKFDDKTMKEDAGFAVAAADGGMLEVRLGQLALSHAASDKVKQFGQMMIDDHSTANTELRALATSKSITIPDSLSAKNTDKYNDLSKKNGADFDKAYTEFMVADHKEDIDEFKKEADKGSDADLKAWAAGKVSVLEHHLQMAESAKDAVKK